jgi:putative FmdB family regulatory protein
MPIYEYFCSGCRRKVEVFRRSMNATGAVSCPNCGGGELSRLVSRFAVHRSVSEFGTAGEESYLQGLEEDDPRAMAAWARRMGEESGEAGDPEFQQMISRMEAGEMPDDFDGGGADDDFDDIGD